MNCHFAWGSALGGIESRLDHCEVQWVAIRLPGVHEEALAQAVVPFSILPGGTMIMTANHDPRAEAVDRVGPFPISRDWPGRGGQRRSGRRFVHEPECSRGGADFPDQRRQPPFPAGCQRSLVQRERGLVAEETRKPDHRHRAALEGLAVQGVVRAGSRRKGLGERDEIEVLMVSTNQEDLRKLHADEDLRALFDRKQTVSGAGSAGAVQEISHEGENVRTVSFNGTRELGVQRGGLMEIGCGQNAHWTGHDTNDSRKRRREDQSGVTPRSMLAARVRLPANGSRTTIGYACTLQIEL